jgi:hypothetical protein
VIFSSRELMNLTVNDLVLCRDEPDGLNNFYQGIKYGRLSGSGGQMVNGRSTGQTERMESDD